MAKNRYLMRILNVNSSIDSHKGGGMAERTFQLSKFLSKAGVECSVLTTDLGLTPERLSSIGNVKVIALPCLNRRFYLPKFSYSMIREAVWDAHIVHFMGHWTFLNALVYKIARRLDKPYVVCPAGALPLFGRSRLLKTAYNQFIGKRIVQNAQGHVAITKGEFSAFEAYGVNSAKISIIPNGINPEEFFFKDDLKFRERFKLDDKPIILFMGRLSYIKGPDLILGAFAAIADTIPNCQLVFAGPDDGMLGALKELAVSSGIERRVSFIGNLNIAERSLAYHAADLLVVPSRQEAMSLVALESGIVGTPVLITDQCGFDEVAEIVGGRVVPATIDGLRDGLFCMLANFDILRTMGENLKKFVAENYNWSSIANKYISLYQNILDNMEL